VDLIYRSREGNLDGASVPSVLRPSHATDVILKSRSESIDPLRLALALALSAPVGMAIWAIVMAFVRLIIPIYWCRLRTGSYCWPHVAQLADCLFGLTAVAIAVFIITRSARLFVRGRKQSSSISTWPSALRWALAVPFALVASTLTFVTAMIASLAFAQAHALLYGIATQQIANSFLIPASLVAEVGIVAPGAKVATIVFTGSCCIATTITAELFWVLHHWVPFWLCIWLFTSSVLGVAAGSFLVMSSTNGELIRTHTGRT
jgi:hypothetical protein